MYTYTTKNLPNNAKNIVITVQWDTISLAQEKAITKLSQSLQIKGFRKGHVPREMSTQLLSPTAIAQESMDSLIPSIYQEILTKEKWSPIITPHIEVTKAEKEKPWEITATIVLTPEVSLGDYKKKVAAAHAAYRVEKEKQLKDQKPATEQQKLDLPTKEEANTSHLPDATGATTNKTPEVNDTDFLQQALDILQKESTVHISDILLKHDVDKKMENLQKEIDKAGLTFETYLASRKLTKEQLQAEFEKSARDLYQIEFAIAELAQQEKLYPTAEEMQAILGAAHTPRERAIAQQNMSWYIQMVTKQKVLDFLNSL